MELEKNTSELICSNFISVSEDENGCFKSLKFLNEDKFNFAFDVMDALAEKSGDKLAMIHIASDLTERRFTFKELMEETNRTANYFTSLGIKKGDKVMLVLKRHYQFWFSILALHKIGAVAIPATNQLRESDFVYRFDCAEISAIVCTANDGTVEQVDKAVEKSNTVKTRIIVDGTREGWKDFNNEYKSFSTDFERTSDSPCGEDDMIMFFTSGTTGYPKIAAHSHKYPLGHFITAKYWHDIKPNGIHLTVSETGWGKALWGKLYGQWLCEGVVFIYDMDRFSAAEMLPMFKKYNIETFCAPPTVYRMLIKEDLSKYDLSSIRYATTAGEALNPEVFRRFKDLTGLTIMEGFGQTETTLTIGNLVGTEPKLGSMGKPISSYKIGLVNTEGKKCDVNENGEIVIYIDERTPCGLFKGYYKGEELTKEAWRGGYYHTGDIAYMDEDGYYWYVGRTDDMIKSSGYKIGPFEIENVIMELPYVLECGVSAEPDEIRGQVAKASIVLTPGTEGTDELKKEIQNYVKTKTAPYKYPRIVVFKDELPKTISGKIIRNQL